MRHSKAVTFVTASLLLVVAPQFVQAQVTDNARFLTLAPPSGLPVIPVMEGWVANEDGSRTISFGFISRNAEAVDIPLGPDNYIEPAEFDGNQPTHFHAGRGTGVFAVTVPADRYTEDVWWYLRTGDGELLKVPGRSGGPAYELDFILPRPQGSLQPLAGFGEDGPQSAGLVARVEDYDGSVRAGEPVTLTVNVTDLSVRDPADPRFGEPLPIGVNFHKWQGPGDVAFTRHESMELPENPFDEDDERASSWEVPDPNDLEVPGASSVARVVATFSAPGGYVIAVKVDNVSAPDSTDKDQCCWTNIFQRIGVR